jgi:hypothetical protein
LEVSTAINRVPAANMSVDRQTPQLSTPQVLKETSGRNFQDPYFFDFRFAFFAVRTLDFIAVFLFFLAADLLAVFFVDFVAVVFAEDVFFAGFFGAVVGESGIGYS